MKKLLSAAGLCISLAISAGAEAADKIAVVDVSAIFQQSPQREAVLKQLKNEFNGREAELRTMEHDLNAKMQKLQRDGSTMKATERNRMEKEMMEQRDKYAAKVQTFEQDNRRRQMEERDNILNTIKNAAQKVASSKGYDIVIDSNAVVYVAKSKNITADVLKQVK